MKYVGSAKCDDEIVNAEEIVICGNGNMLSKLLEYFEKEGLFIKIVAICDSDVSKKGELKDGIIIDTYERIIELFPNADYVVYNRFKKEILELLLSKEIKKIHLLLEI